MFVKQECHLCESSYVRTHLVHVTATLSDQGCSVTSSALDLPLRVVEDNAGNEYVPLDQTDKEQFSNTRLLTSFARTNCFATSSSTPSSKRFCSRELTLRAFKLGAFSGDNHGTAATMTLNCDLTDPLKISKV